MVITDENMHGRFSIMGHAPGCPSTSVYAYAVCTTGLYVEFLIMQLCDRFADDKYIHGMHCVLQTATSIERNRQKALPEIAVSQHCLHRPLPLPFMTTRIPVARDNRCIFGNYSVLLVCLFSYCNLLNYVCNGLNNVMPVRLSDLYRKATSWQSNMLMPIIFALQFDGLILIMSANASLGTLGHVTDFFWSVRSA